MCGIFGVWNLDGSGVDVAAVVRATTAIRHRGPDDEGYLLINTRSGRTELCGGKDTTSELRLPDIFQFAGEKFDLAFGFRRLSILDLTRWPSADGESGQERLDHLQRRNLQLHRASR